MRIGIISDTHGLLRPEVFHHFDGVDRILHAGDIGDLDILAQLGTIAEVDAVFGNTDGMEIRARVAEKVERELAGRTLLLVHGHQLGAPTPDHLARAFAEPDIVVFGHTHRPAEKRIGGRLFINPGGAGAPRFGLPPSIALLDLDETREEFRLIQL